ncbi:MAG: bifunctional folylpolyglutamate synthase/dihydrofolate synthase [Clostridiales bacterium]|nr:bifunctional folylpolyglutamate synthase/dihydrofolate synthase [Clostridiales bacterium]
MTYEEALAYIHSTHWQGKRPGLNRVRELLGRLGDPQQRLRFVHVAGTNGKGSVCACMASVLQAAGYRTGCFTSPFLERFNERFQIDGVPISDEALCRLTERVRPAADQMEDAPNEFDLITALALVWFADEGCDIVVLEVGLGGTLDPTNVIDCPDLAVITALGLDHTRQLGDTLPEIAGAKAGIIKPGGQVVYYGGAPEADEVVRRVCREQGAALTVPDWSRLEVLAWEPDCTLMSYDGLDGLRLPLLAAYQPRNAALAVTGARLLRDRGWHIPEAAIRQGIETVRWPGRFELLRREPPFLLDGAHNPQGVRATAESLRLRYPGRRFVFLMGVMADKDAASMIAPLAPLAEEFVTVTPPSPRSLPADTLAEEIRRRTGLPARACGSIEEGVELALGRCRPDTGVCALGSLYFSAAIRQAANARF